IRIDYRWAGPDVESLRAHATELVRSNPDLIVADSTAALTVLRRLSGDIPAGMIAHDGFWRTIEAAAAPLTGEARAILVRHAADIESAIVAAAGAPNNGVILLPHAIIEANRFMIIEMAARHQLPAIYPLRHYAAAGGLIAYGLEPRNLYRQVAVYVD